MTKTAKNKTILFMATHTSIAHMREHSQGAYPYDGRSETARASAFPLPAVNPRWLAVLAFSVCLRVIAK